MVTCSDDILLKFAVVSASSERHGTAILGIARAARGHWCFLFCFVFVFVFSFTVALNKD